MADTLASLLRGTPVRPYWESINNMQLLQSILAGGNFESAVRALQASPRLPSEADVTLRCSIAEAWHWRARAAMLANTVGDHPDSSRVPAALLSMTRRLPAAVGLAAQQAKLRGYIDNVVDGDFDVEGAAFGARRDIHNRTLAVASARLAALGWVLKRYPWNMPEELLTYATPVPPLFAPESEK